MMKQKIQLHIAEPCHENWNKMNATEQGRFCMSCQKEVVDFSVMTDKEILQYISKASSNICGRAQDDQLNRVIQQPVERKQFSFKYFWSILITSALISNKFNGQVQPPKEKIVSLPVGTPGEKVPIILGGIRTLKQEDRPTMQIKGRVADAFGKAVPYASVSINGTTAGVATDKEGFFSLKTKEELKNFELVISSVGFITQTKKVKADQIQSIEVKNNTIKINIANISLQTKTMDEIVVTGYGTTTGKMTVGLMTTVTRYTILDSIKSILPGSEIKVYPNPVPQNSSFNISFNIKDAGEYNVLFMDASGKLLQSKMINIVSNKQVENFSSNGFQRSGIYFIMVKGQTKTYSAKIVVQ